MQQTFNEWVLAQIEARDWSVRELARRAGVSHGAINNVLNDLRNPGPDLCQALARALHVPAEEVFRRAGLLPERPSYNVREERALYLFSRLPDAAQEYLLTTMEALIEKNEAGERADERSPTR